MSRQAGIATATAPQREFFNRTMEGPQIEAVTKMREAIASGGLSGELAGLDAG